VNFELPELSLFPKTIAEHPNLCGLNVTIPYKERIIPYLDRLDPLAEAIGAVNVIRLVRKEDGKMELTGYNSDIIGFMRSIRPLLKPHHRKALILGTGGASKAVIHGLRQLGLETLSVSRTPSEETIGYSELTEEIMQEYTVIVNTTPLGMFPHTGDCPKLPYELLTAKHLLYDLVYNPETTLFLRKGMAQGAATQNGLEMLRLQAEAAWEIWNEK
jgi:shikimate dehydrogenase